jgi:ferrous iron transport protein B
MLISFLFVLWITIKGANYPSTILYQFFFFLEKKIKFLFLFLNSPEWLTGLLIDGIYRNLAWVVSVMLPPMAIFFPCFTFLEDLGFLPRIAFHLDTLFKKVGGHGKQALTMCMGFGCNAAGVISTRIIGSQKEKLIAILTNNFVPCNGRFPTLILLSTLFISPLVEKKYSSLFTALTVMLIILIGIFFTFLVSWILSKTILKGEPSSFILELPPIRKPRILSILYRSFIERTLAVLWRAVIVSAPVGAIIWMGGNILYNNRPIILTLSNFFEFPGTLLGMNGLILLSFILAFPANEILFPIIIMVYTQSGRLTDINSTQELYDLLILNGWNLLTAVNLMLFSLLHFPCGTVLLSIYKETKSKKWTFYSAIIPTIIACIVTYLTTLIFKDFFH